MSVFTVTGARDTANVLSDQIAIDLADQIFEIEPDVQPLAVFSSKASKSRTVSPQFGWIEDSAKPRFDITSNTATNVITTIPVTTGASYQQHDQWLNTRTGEQFRVESVTSSTAIVVTRGIGSTAAAMNNGDELLLIGNAQPENDTSKVARSANPSKVQNFTQIFREPFESSGTLMASGSQVNPLDWAFQGRKSLREHVKDKEYTFLVGRKSLDVTSTHPTRTTGGALSFIATNSTDAGGTLSETTLNTFLLQVNRFGTTAKFAMGSGVAVSALNKFPASKQQTAVSDSTYGVNVMHYVSPFGSLNLVWHKLLEGTKYAGYLIVLDMDQTGYRYLANDSMNRDTKVLTNRQPNDQDGRKDEVLTECGLQFGLEKTHGVLINITG